MTTRGEHFRQLFGTEVRSCLVIAPPRESHESLMRDATGGGGCSIETFDDPLRAFAEAALHERLAAKRAAWGLDTPARTCIVIHRPDDIEALDEIPLVVAATRTYLPLVLIAIHDPESSEPWQDVEGKPLRGRSQGRSKTPKKRDRAESDGRDQSLRSDDDGDDASDAPPLRERTRAGRTLRLVNAEDRAARRSTPKAREQRSDIIDENEESIPTVTREELAMLLKPDDDSDDNDRASEAMS